MSDLDPLEFERQVTGLLAEAISIEQYGVHEPKFSDYHNGPGKRGALHYPEPIDDSRPSSYDQDMAYYLKRKAAQKEAEQAEAYAKEIIKQQPQIRERICEALKSVNDDAKDIAKIICAALLPLSITGVITLPLTPIVCLGIGLVVWRAGTSGFCTGVGRSKK